MKHLIKIFLPVIIVIIAGPLARAQGASPNLTVEIKKQLGTNAQVLAYPKSVARYYAQNNYQPAWIKLQGGMGPAWQGMLMIDCVLAFGLSHDDYHPKELTYDILHKILDTPDKVNIGEQAKYELLLTDAMLNLMNNLHYGKLNPDYTPAKIDQGIATKFSADSYLTDVLKTTDLMAAIAAVQPKIKMYTDLQRRMQILKGKYQDDCYEVPQAEVRQIAINMERLRWAAINDDSYILINIPAYSLVFQQPDTAYQFKIAVGKPESPTPTVQGAIDYFTTAPDPKVLQNVFVDEIIPKALKDLSYLKTNHYAIYDNSGHFIPVTAAALNQIANYPYKYYARQSAGRDIAHGNLVFHFPNALQIYLHDMPKKDAYNQKERALSNGCIWLDDAEKLGELLLTKDGATADIKDFKKALAKRQRKTFTLKTTTPVKVIYITCAINDYGTESYKDIYNLDPALEMALYNLQQPLSMRGNK